jgi:iron complex transport system substrate-binding protein
VLEMNPDVIVASGMGESRPDWLDAWGQYQHLTAVKTNSLYHIHPDLLHRPTPRFLLGTRQLCEAMEKTRQKQQSPED